MLSKTNVVNALFRPINFLAIAHCVKAAIENMEVSIDASLEILLGPTSPMVTDRLGSSRSIVQFA